MVFELGRTLILASSCVVKIVLQLKLILIRILICDVGVSWISLESASGMVHFADAFASIHAQIDY